MTTPLTEKELYEKKRLYDALEDAKFYRKAFSFLAGVFAMVILLVWTI